MKRSISAFGLSLPVAGDVERVVERRPAPARREPRDEPAGEVRCEWDAEGRVVAILAPGSSQWLRFEHGAPGELRVRAQGGHVYLDAAANVAVLDNGVVERYGFDAAGRPTRVEATGPAGEEVLALDIAYAGDGRIVRLGGVPIAYAGARVAGATPAAAPATYEHDEHGNRSARHAPGEPPTRYAYDGDGRLVAVTRGGQTLVRYGYDDAGRRVRREDAAGTTLSHYDLAGNLLAETDGAGRAIATYVCVGTRCLARIDGPVGAPAAAWHHLDHAGSAWAVTDCDGAVVGRRSGPFHLTAPGPYMRRHRDPATGFFHFGARDLDPETGTFTTPDAYTFDAADPRLAADPRRDPWGGDGPQRTVLRNWQQTPELRERYTCCLGDPINNVDLDGHSAWWFFLTIPLSLTWALPNTAIALILVVLNFAFELIGWVHWLFRAGEGAAGYPWGRIGQNSTNTQEPPLNPYDRADRDHFWMNFDASARQGVPWALFSGSFWCFGRAFTLGNVVLENDLADSGYAGDTFQRYVVPTDPDVQFTLHRAVREHEMQHVLQYSYLGPFFHALPLPLIADAFRPLPDTHPDRPGLLKRSEWWKHIDALGGLELTLGGLVWVLTAGAVHPATFAKVINPGEWWRRILPKDSSFAKIATQAIDLGNWGPGPGIYEIDIWRGDNEQRNSTFERMCGLMSGHTYGTVVEAEKRSLVVGEFTRVIGLGLPRGPQATPGGGVSTMTRPPEVTWTITPDAPLPAGAPGTQPAGAPAEDFLVVEDAANVINLDAKNNLATERVTNGAGLYFHTTQPGTYTVQASTVVDNAPATDDVEIVVEDITVAIDTQVFICQGQMVVVIGDPGAVYSLNLNPPSTSGSTVSGLAYTAGSTATIDTIELLAQYDATAGPFATYGDGGGLAASPWVVKTYSVNVAEPTISPLAASVFVGGFVDFTFDLDPQSATVGPPANLFGSQYLFAAKRFVAGRASIDAPVTETITFAYACRSYTVTITINPIIVTPASATLKPGATTNVVVAGGTPPMSYDVSDQGSLGSSIDQNGVYTAGSTAGTDTVTVTDSNGGRGTASIVVAP